MIRKLDARAAVVIVCLTVLNACSSGANSTQTIPSTNARQTTISAADSAAVQRPISQFVNAQGTFCVPPASGVPAGAAVVDGCVIFVPPVANFEGWGTLQPIPQCPNGILLAAVDYAGLANQFIVGSGGRSLGTTTSGSITERPLANGSARVDVVLHTKNALAWAGCDPAFDFATATLFFGNRAPDVLAGASAALANSQLHVVFTEPRLGAPMPDLIQLIAFPLPGQSLNTLQFYASASGDLKSAFGVPNGTAGQLVVAQTGTLRTTGKASADGFTAEVIHISAK